MRPPKEFDELLRRLIASDPGMRNRLSDPNTRVYFDLEAASQTGSEIRVRPVLAVRDTSPKQAAYSFLRIKKKELADALSYWSQSRSAHNATDAKNAGNIDEGLFGVCLANGVFNIVETSAATKKILYSYTGGALQFTIPPPREMLAHAVSVLKSATAKESSQSLAGLLIQHLVILHGEAWDVRSLRDLLAMSCGVVWARLCQSESQDRAYEAKRSMDGRIHSAQVRSKAKSRIDQFRELRAGCEKANKHFVKREACRTIARNELKDRKKRDRVEDQESWVESRTKQIEAELREKYPDDFGKKKG